MPGEGVIYYDIRVAVKIPGNNGTIEPIKILINLEAQKSYHPGYDLVTRAIFYTARMLSAQLSTEFSVATEDNKKYNNIKKVYSIWICMDATGSAANTIDQYLSTESSTPEKKGILYLLCAQFHKAAEYITRQPDQEKLLYKIFSFVEEEFAGDCSLANLAQKTGYDYSYLSRFFKKIVGIPFNFYVNHYRLSHACYLLENTTLPILQCAYESGYTSLRSFNRNFKSQFQLTSAQYRSKAT